MKEVELWLCDSPSGNDCTGDWGWSFVAMALVGAGLYVGGGVGYARKTGGGAGAGLAAHPHYRMWQSVHAMVMDGIAFAKGRANGGGGSRGVYERVPLPPDRIGEGETAEGRGSNRKSGRSGAGSSKGRGKSGKKKSSTKHEKMCKPGREAEGGATEEATKGRWVHVPT